ncbi:MAG: MerR family transcriptional regulator [Sphingomonas bacterium]|nr:MerR family transcriptional regulator [Sphingomonas bacterium]
MTSAKDPGAFKTIGELSEELGVAQHILRYWESKFPQLKPLQRAGNRRYYRPADADLARRIKDLLANHGYTIRGVQKLLGAKGEAAPAPEAPAIPMTGYPLEAQPLQVQPLQVRPETPAVPASAVDFERLVGLRDKLVAALGE